MNFLGSGIVFNQTWEDFDVDKELLELKPTDTLLAITSGGCNILNACLAGPKRIFAVDDNPAQNHLLRLKIAAINTLEYSEFWQMFGVGKSAHNVDLYFQKIRLALPARSQEYWDKNIKIFKSGFLKVGSLGTLSLLRMCIQRLCGADRLKYFCDLEDISAQTKYYIEEIEPRLWVKATSYVPTFTMVAYGAHLRQIYFCHKAGAYFLKDLYKEKQRFLFTHVPIKTNYFWYYVMFGKYRSNIDCPDYLQERNFESLKKNINSIEIHDGTIINLLETQGANSINKFSISDVVEFSGQGEVERLWKEVIRTASNGALVSYRSFAPDIFPPAGVSKSLKYFADESKTFSLKERTASYSNVYKYEILK